MFICGRLGEKRLQSSSAVVCRFSLSSVIYSSQDEMRTLLSKLQTYRSCFFICKHERVISSENIAFSLGATNLLVDENGMRALGERQNSRSNKRRLAPFPTRRSVGENKLLCPNGTGMSITNYKAFIGRHPLVNRGNNRQIPSGYSRIAYC